MTKITDILKKWEEVKEKITITPWGVDSKNRVVNNDNAIIAQCHWPRNTGKYEVSSIEFENAHFIASAPEVISALCDGMKKALIGLEEIFNHDPGTPQGCAAAELLAELGDDRLLKELKEEIEYDI